METLDEQNTHVIKRMNRTVLVSAIIFTVIIVGALWGEKTKLLWIVGSMSVVAPLNAWLTMSQLQKWRVTTTEIFRLLANIAALLIVNHMTGWPTILWAWLPFYALSLDGFRPKTTWIVLMAFCAACFLLAIHDGVSWQYPAITTALAYYARLVTNVRTEIVREMAVKSEAQRRSLDEAHASLQAAHEHLKQAIDAQQQTEIELRQAQKLEAVGRLAAGVAHEMNTPLQFIMNSVQFIDDGMQSFLRLMRRVRDATPAQIQRALDDEDVPYLETNLPEALNMTKDGLERVASIVASLKEFAYSERSTRNIIDLNHAIDTTLTVAKHEYKYVADVKTELMEIPLVRCHGGEIHQVLLNLMINAAHAVTDRSKEGNRGHITLRTARVGDDVLISVSDDGTGIPENVRDKIFEPFFTTKEVGRGTGQGLAIARAIIERHHGAIWFESKVGVGTTFFVRLPIEDSQAAAPQHVAA